MFAAVSKVKVMEDGDVASGIRQEGTLLHHYNHYRRRRTRLPTNGHARVGCVQIRARKYNYIYHIALKEVTC